MKKESGIYCIENLVNGKKYIGSAVNINGRLRSHKSMLRNKTHHSKKLQNSYNKYGEVNFKFYRIARCPKEYNIKLEQWFIDSFDTFKNGYNMQPNAASRLGTKVSEETRQKMSESRKGIPGWSKGLKRPEVSEWIKKANTGRVVSEETKNKMSEAHKGKQHSLGIKHSRERIIKTLNSRDTNVYFDKVFKITKPCGKELILEGYPEVLNYFNCNRNSAYLVITGKRKTLYKHKIEIYNG